MKGAKRLVPQQLAADLRKVVPPSAHASPDPFSSAASRPGSAFAQAVMLPAPRQTTRSPGRALGDQRRQLVGPSTARHPAVAVAAQALDQGSRPTPSIGVSPAA